MNQQNQQIDNELEENKQAQHTLSMLIWISWSAYLIILFSGIYFGDSIVIIATLISSALLIFPFWLLKHGHTLISGLFLVLIVLANVTLLATTGQGIHDIAIMAYPIIIIFASMALNRVFFRISVVLVMASMGWLVFGEANGLFVSHAYLTPNWVDFLIIGTILLVVVFTTDMLVTKMRQNLSVARQEIAQRIRVEEQLRYQSTYDVMTGIYNRNFFETELARLERGREFPVTIIIADIDGLKLVNDTKGHTAGDELLQQTAKILRSVFREGDILARIGGDEFAILLPATNWNTAELIVLRIKDCLVEHKTRFSEMPMQLSIGAATAEKSNLTETFTLADHRMYAEKAAHKAKAND